MSRSRSRLAADWFAKLRVKVGTQEVEHADVEVVDAATAEAIANIDLTPKADITYVDTAIGNLIGGAPGTLNTLNELAQAINDDASYASTLTTALSTKLSLVGGTMTGNITLGINNVTFTNWTVTESAGVLKFATGGVNKMKLDASGNLTVAGNVTAFGSI